MQRCLQIAAKGFGHTRSNPLVGCVVLHENIIISEGYHKGFGMAHAEVEALKNITDATILNNCTVYVNLEPCSHQGKTPPCADFLISKGVKKIVIGTMDPNPVVAGNGIKKLKAAGVEISVDVLISECMELNKRFFTFHTKKRPYIILKWAQSKDGFIAPINQTAIFRLTNSATNILVHQWRSHEMGILVGRNTVEKDNPELTVRHIEGENPVRIIIDPHNKLSEENSVFNNQAKTLVFNNAKNETKETVEWIKLTSKNIVEELLQKLYERNIISVLIEGGKNTLESFINQSLWDEARIFKTPIILNEGIMAPAIEGKCVGESFIESDQLIYLIPA